MADNTGTGHNVNWRPEWLDQPTSRRPTEILLPVELAIGPVWDHPNQVGGWFAALNIPMRPDGMVQDWVYECGHLHDDQDSAWTCAERAAEDLAREVLRGR